MTILVYRTDWGDVPVMEDVPVPEGPPHLLPEDDDGFSRWRWPREPDFVRVYFLQQGENLRDHKPIQTYTEFVDWQIERKLRKTQ